MKIKYSDAIKKEIPWELLQECIQLVFSIVPIQSVHIFKLEVEGSTVNLDHIIPEVSYKGRIKHSCTFDVDIQTEIVVIKRRNCIYCITMKEYLSL